MFCKAIICDLWSSLEFIWRCIIVRLSSSRDVSSITILFAGAFISWNNVFHIFIFYFLFHRYFHPHSLPPFRKEHQGSMEGSLLSHQSFQKLLILSSNSYLWTSDSFYQNWVEFIIHDWTFYLPCFQQVLKKKCNILRILFSSKTVSDLNKILFA